MPRREVFVLARGGNFYRLTHAEFCPATSHFLTTLPNFPEP